MSEVSREELDAILERHRDALAAEKDWRRNRIYDEMYEWRDAAEDLADEVDRLRSLNPLPPDAAKIAYLLESDADMHDDKFADEPLPENRVSLTSWYKRRAAAILRGEA